MEEDIKLYRLLPELFSKEEWLKKFQNHYELYFMNDIKFKNFFEPTKENFNKKMQYMLERLETGKSSIKVEEIVTIPDGLWD